MAATGKGRWWGRVLFGIFAIIFGIVTFVVPKITLTLFLFIFGLFMLVSGIVLIAYGARRASIHRWLNVVEGVVDLIIAFAAFFYTGLTAIAIVYLFAAFATISGILQIGESLFSSRETKQKGPDERSRWLLTFSGIWSLIIGILLFLFPMGGIIVALWIVGIFAIIVGILNISAGFRARKPKSAT